MGVIQGPVICRPVVKSKHAGVSALPVNTSVTKGGLQRSGFWGSNMTCNAVVKAGTLFRQPSDHDRTGRFTCCSSRSSSDNNIFGNFSEKDEEYVNSSVIEAVEVKSGSDGFMIKMRDGRHVRCVHNTPQEGQLPDYAPHPAIVLKMEDGSDLLLPIIVLEMPTIMLMAAVRNIQIARPTIYNIIQEMIDKMGYEARLVRVTKRVNEAYFAQLYLTKVDNEKEFVSLDLRPSDAINIAVRCKVAIQVNKHLAQTDGMRVIEPKKKAMLVSLPSEGLLFTKLDRPDGHPCLETKEFILVRNMLIAAVEERYGDAARWRDKLRLLRTKRGKMT